MRIGVNLIPLRPGQMGGHEFYVHSLLEHLLAHDRHNRYFLFTAPWNDASLDFQQWRYRKILAVPAAEPEADVADESRLGFGRYASLQTLPFVRYWASSPARDLHEWVRRLRLQLWFCPMTDLDPRQLPIPTVITVADIQQEFYPEFFSREELHHRALMYPPSCQEATAVITVSNASRKSLIDKYSLPEKKVHLVYEAGIARRSASSPEVSADHVRDKYRLPSMYALYPANMWPHKNHQLLLLALHRLRQRHGVSLPLVLTGDDLGQWETLQETAGHFQLQAQVHYLGYVAAEEVTSLYAGATMLVFPSLYEGFGLPLLEAMRLGCPVAASNLTSIPEVVGEAGLLFDPRSPDSIAEAMHRLIADNTLRQTLSTRGREQAARFSWEKAAGETLEVFGWARAHHQAVHQETRVRRTRLDGVYLDGWAKRRVRLNLPFCEDVQGVKLDGLSDYIAYPVTIRMKLCGQPVGVQTLERPGKFSMVGMRGVTWVLLSHLKIELVANRDFIPYQAGISPDSRRLAYIIERLALICRDGREVPLYTRPPLPGYETAGDALLSG
jgi:glycosyltransferase involved in cell wall biosynthesis